MTPTTDQLYQVAMTLPEDERAELARRLLDSLAVEVPSQLHPAWREELYRRLAQVDSGEVIPVPWSEVKQSAWKALAQDEAPPRG